MYLINFSYIIFLKVSDTFTTFHHSFMCSEVKLCKMIASQRFLSSWINWEFISQCAVRRWGLVAAGSLESWTWKYILVPNSLPPIPCFFLMPSRVLWDEQISFVLPFYCAFSAWEPTCKDSILWKLSQK